LPLGSGKARANATASIIFDFPKRVSGKTSQHQSICLGDDLLAGFFLANLLREANNDENLPPPFGPITAVRDVNGPIKWRPRNDLKLTSSTDINLLKHVLICE